MARRRFRLIPREESFYDLFVRNSEILVQAAALLMDLVTTFEDTPAKARRMHDLEHEGDEVTHEIMRRLYTTFVTPLDHEDIHELATTFDNVLDHVDAAADLLVLHRIEQPLPEMKAQAALLERGAEATLEAVRRLPAFDTLQEYFVEVNRLENEGDRIHRQAIADLFSGDFKAMDVLKWKDIIDELEAAMDELEDVANTLEGIALKHG